MQNEISNELKRIIREAEELRNESKVKIDQLTKEKLDLVKRYEAKISELENTIKTQRDEFERKLSIEKALRDDLYQTLEGKTEEIIKLTESLKEVAPESTITPIHSKEESAPKPIKFGLRKIPVDLDDSLDPIKPLVTEELDDRTHSCLLQSLLADRTQILSSGFVTPDDDIIKMLDRKIQELSK